MTITRQTPLLLKAILCAIGLFWASPGSARDPGLIFPPDQVSVSQGEIRAIGLSKETEATVAIQLKTAKGEQTFNAPVTAGAYNQAITLAPGLNTISVAGGTDQGHAIFLATADAGQPPKGFKPLYLHSKNELTGTCEQCHTLSLKDPDYLAIKQQLSCITQSCHNTLGNKQYKHGPFKNGSCVECHKPHGTTTPKFLKLGKVGLCFSCHKEDEGMATSGKVVHFPVKQGECTVCHDPHQSNQPHHLKGDSIAALCSSCHNKSMVAFKYMHAPFKSGDCNACHSPHVSEFKGLLYEGGSALCLNCHKEREEEFKRKFVHEPVKKDCTICHDPHGSETPAHLRTPKDKDGKYLRYEQPLKESCLSCHRKLNPEVAKQIEHSTVTHKPVVEGKCTICHTPHSTNFKKQLNTSLQDACFKCHEDLKKQIKESKYQHGPVRTDDCGQCHQVHGSEHRLLLRANFTENYSESFDLKHYELCFNCHNSKVYADSKNTETGFRNGSVNLHFLHVNRDKEGRTCRTCHDIHASNQPKHLRTSIPYKKKFTITLEYTKTDTGGGCVVGCHNPRKYDREKPIATNQ